jgi:hypothetical protein
MSKKLRLSSVVLSTFLIVSIILSTRSITGTAHSQGVINPYFCVQDTPDNPCPEPEDFPGRYLIELVVWLPDITFTRSSEDTLVCISPIYPAAESNGREPHKGHMLFFPCSGEGVDTGGDEDEIVVYQLEGVAEGLQVWQVVKSLGGVFGLGYGVGTAIDTVSGWIDEDGETLSDKLADLFCEWWCDF